MRNAFNRGSSPDRARDWFQRSGSFEPGHKKLGGRKKGTPNLISASHKKAMREAIHRIGSDGNGKDGNACGIHTLHFPHYSATLPAL